MLASLCTRCTVSAACCTPLCCVSQLHSSRTAFNERTATSGTTRLRSLRSATTLFARPRHATGASVYSPTPARRRVVEDFAKPCSSHSRGAVPGAEPREWHGSSNSCADLPTEFASNTYRDWTDALRGAAPLRGRSLVAGNPSRLSAFVALV